MGTFTTTLERVSLVELSPPFERLNFQFMPEGITWKRDAQIQSVAIVGRNNPVHQYIGGTDSLNFSLSFHSDEENREDVKRKVDWLKSLAMSDAGFGPARKVRLVMGKFYNNETWLIKGVSVSYKNIDQRFDFLPLQATVQLSLMLDPETNRTISDVRNQR
jgi:hypothetical protein